jgi:hypothetical protein
MELALKFAPSSEVRRFNVAKFDPGLPPFGANFRHPGGSFHEVVSDDEEDEEQMKLREKEDREKELLKAKGGARNPDEWRMKGMREDATDVSWIIEDSSNSVGYSGKMLQQKRAQYVVMVARKQSKEVLVMPVQNWFKFDRLTKQKSAERRLQEQRARTNFKAESAPAGRPKSKLSALLAERTKPQGGDDDGGKLGGDDDASQQGGSDVDDGMEFEGANSDDEADGRIGAMGKRESESEEGEGNLADDTKEGKGRLGRKFAEQQDQSDSDLDAGPTRGNNRDDGGLSDSDGEAGRSYHKIDSNTWGSDASGGSGSDLSADELAKVDVDDDDIIDGVDLSPGAAAAAAPAAASAASQPAQPVYRPTAPGLIKQEPRGSAAAAAGGSAAANSSAATSGGGKKRARESPPPAERPQKKKSLILTKKPKEAGGAAGAAGSGGASVGMPAVAESGIKLEEGAIAAYLRSRKVSMKEFLGAFDKAGKAALKSTAGKKELKTIMQKLKVRTEKDPNTKVAYLVFKQ